MTGNGNSFYLLALASNFSWKHFRWTCFWRIWAISNHCAWPRPAMCGGGSLLSKGLQDPRLSHCVIASTSTIEAFKLRKSFMRPLTPATAAASEATTVMHWRPRTGKRAGTAGLPVKNRWRHSIVTGLLWSVSVNLNNQSACSLDLSSVSWSSRFMIQLHTVQNSTVQLSVVGRSEEE